VRSSGLSSLIVLLALACAKPQTASPSPTTAQPPQPTTTTSAPSITFPDNYVVRVEVAADDETRAQGLMYRDRLPEAAGMIFIFPQAGEYPFWMKNCLISLDLIWLDAAHKIVHIAHDVPPCKADPCPNYPPNATASYVLEVAGGVAAKHHLAAGQTLRFSGLDHVVVH
jgi:uncharacterized membrane protein (UPF0127 family)